jgi:RsiW-degrading membrane proteinase PrsW (M82 family)
MGKHDSRQVENCIYSWSPRHPSAVATSFEEQLMHAPCDSQRPMPDGLRRRTAIVSMVLTVGLCFLAAAAALAAEDTSPPSPADAQGAKSLPSRRPPAINIELESQGSADSDDQAQTPGKHARHSKAHIQLGSQSFDSFDDAMQAAPWFVAVLLLLVGTLFLTPVILLVGMIWYKLRKTRLQNEAMLKLAERGVISPSQAASAVASGVSPPVPAAASPPGSAFPQVVSARRRAVWSDLRKGVIITAVGLSFVFYSMLDSATANWVGLLLMFVGIGYLVLWWLEDRHLRDSLPSQSTGPGNGPT